MSDSPLHLLLVEDHEPDARLIRESLQESGAAATLVWAPALAPALNRIGEERFDCVLLDPGLPDCQGQECIGLVLAALPASVPVVLVTGQEDIGVGEAAVQAGAADFLPKSQAHPAELLRVVRMAIARRAARLAAEAGAEPLRVLFVEDNPNFARPFAELLRRSHSRPLALEVVPTLREARARLEREPFDIVLLDPGLEDSQGVKSFAGVLEPAGGAPIIVLTAGQNIEAEEIMKSSAQGYHVKDATLEVPKAVAADLERWSGRRVDPAVRARLLEEIRQTTRTVRDTVERHKSDGDGS